MKRIVTLALLFAVSTHVLAWGHSSYGSRAGAERAAKLRGNTAAHYGGRVRVK
jgi:hypothetical protein